MKVKTLTKTGLDHLIGKIREMLLPAEQVYQVQLKAGSAYSFSIPEYDARKSQVDVYLNGLRLAIAKEYTLSSAGLVSLTTPVHTETNYILVIHRKWEG